MSGSPVVAETMRTRPYFPELDGVRAIAALMVMVFHFSFYWHRVGFLILGQTGVDLFFVLSGFLITTILLQSPHGDWEEIRKFYIRRTLRIFPLYYGYLIAMSLIGGAVSIAFWIYLQNWSLGLALPLHGPAHFWSLAVEEQFYLVWPFLVLFWPRRWLMGTMFGLIALSVGLRFVLQGHLIDVFYLTVTRLDGLAGGGLLALFYGQGKLIRGRGWLMGLGLAGFVGLGAEYGFPHAPGVPWVQATKVLFATAVYVASVGLLLIWNDTVIHRCLRMRGMRALGRVSYGMYVFHPIVFEWLPGHLGRLPLLAKAVISFVAVYVVSAISFYGFEKRFTDLKGRLAPEKRFAVIEPNDSQTIPHETLLNKDQRSLSGLIEPASAD